MIRNTRNYRPRKLMDSRERIDPSIFPGSRQIKSKVYYPLKDHGTRTRINCRGPQSVNIFTTHPRLHLAIATLNIAGKRKKKRKSREKKRERGDKTERSGAEVKRVVVVVVDTEKLSRVPFHFSLSLSLSLLFLTGNARRCIQLRLHSIRRVSKI